MDKPIVTTMTPDASTVGCRIKVTGSNLSDVTWATVGGVTCEVKDVTPTTLIVVVADDAKSGPVIVGNEAGIAGTAPLFTVTADAKVEKKAEVMHHEHEAHREEQVARDKQQWPNKHKKKW